MYAHVIDSSSENYNLNKKKTLNFYLKKNNLIFPI